MITHFSWSSTKETDNYQNYTVCVIYRMACRFQNLFLKLKSDTLFVMTYGIPLIFYIQIRYIHNVLSKLVGLCKQSQKLRSMKCIIVINLYTFSYSHYSFAIVVFLEYFFFHF